MRAGLEVHQQLATSKLFCDCPSELSEEVRATVSRKLRPTGGELTGVDPAAQFEASLDQTFRYEVVPTSCLVELDEEPPHAINPDAVEVALELALLLHADPLDEIPVMRKIVIDGSNTAGFQRTALVAVGGWIDVDGTRYPIESVCLEEDAARKILEDRGEVRYRLDRLGIPLVEVATGPEITSPERARAVAQAIGALLRATRRVRRGIGTIREDLNLSVEGGTRVEIKGVQELRLLATYATEEVARQEMLLRVKAELGRRGAKPPEGEPTEVTELLRGVKSGPVATALARGGRAFALALPGFATLLGRPDAPGPRFGRELADHARTAGVAGILHSDELPTEAVGEEAVRSIRSRLALAEADAFALVASPDAQRAVEALARVRRRAVAAFAGVPPETRDPLPDGTTRYSRPLPGRSRMYPETDVPPVPVPRERLEALRARLPELPDATRERLQSQYGLPEDAARQLVQDGEAVRFEALAGRGHPVPAISRLLLQELPALRARPAFREPSDEALGELLSALAEGRFAKEGLAPVLEAVAVGGQRAGDAVSAAGLSLLTEDQLEAVIERVLDSNAALIAERGRGALSPLMGDVMREVRGRFDGKAVADRLGHALARRVERASPGT